MDYFNNVLTTFLGLECVSCIAVYAVYASWSIFHLLLLKFSEVIFCVKNRLIFKMLFIVFSNMLHRDVVFELTVHN